MYISYISMEDFKTHMAHSSFAINLLFYTLLPTQELFTLTREAIELPSKYLQRRLFTFLGDIVSKKWLD